MVFAPGPESSPTSCSADEINRPPPQTQSASSRGDQEHRVTIQDAPTSSTTVLFFATQTRSSSNATYPLPEAQLDRFMSHIIVCHPPYGE